MEEQSLEHTRWNCKYHIIFAPKFRRKIVYGKYRKEIGSILRKLCEYKRMRYWKRMRVLIIYTCVLKFLQNIVFPKSWAT